MLLSKATKQINEWVPFFSILPRSVRTIEVENGKKIEVSDTVMLCKLERRVSYASGVRKGIEYRLPEKPKEVKSPKQGV